jgi:hypothetical protein
VNCYEALATESDTSDCGNRMKWVCENENENKPKVKNNSQKENMMHTEQNCLVIKELQEELNRKTTVQHNLQNSRLTHRQKNTKAEIVTYTVPSIINGRTRD